MNSVFSAPRIPTFLLKSADFVTSHTYWFGASRPFTKSLACERPSTRNISFGGSAECVSDIWCDVGTERQAHSGFERSAISTKHRKRTWHQTWARYLILAFMGKKEIGDLRLGQDPVWFLSVARLGSHTGISDSAGRWDLPFPNTDAPDPFLTTGKPKM